MTNKDKGDSSVLGGVPSDDDDDDEDWNSRRNNKKKDKNGSKKNRSMFTQHEKPVQDFNDQFTGTPKKGIDQEPSDAVNVDIEGELTQFQPLSSIQFCVN